MTPPPDPFSTGRHIGSLWLGLLGPPAVWLVQFQANYTLTAWVCAHGHRSVLALVSLAAFVAIAALGALAWSRWQQSGRRWPGAEGSTAARTRFVALLGLLSSGLFALTTLAQAVAPLFIAPCWQ